MADRMMGTVKWFNTTKGYGFIAPDDGAKDIFVHVTAVQSTSPLGEGDRVEFGLEESDKGPKAIEVVKV